MKKYIILAFIANVLIVASYFLYQSHQYSSNISKIQSLGGSIGYGMHEVFSISFAETDITDEELEEVLKYFTDLRQLDLSRTNITSLSNLYHLYDLQELNISESKVSQNEVTKIKKVLPGLSIINAPVDYPVNE